MAALPRHALRPLLLGANPDTGVIREWWLAAWVCAALCLVAVALGQVDARTLHGVSVWSKPAKFWLSLVVYFATLAWLAPLLPAQYFARLEGKYLVRMTLLVAAFEMVYICLQAAHGVASHFNVSSELHASLYSLMGLGASLLVLACLWFGVRVLLHRGLGEPFALAAGLGLVLAFVLGGGFGGYLGSHMSHWVGGSESDAGGLPLIGWSTDGGDLRVAHFFGLHAMQALPLAGLLATRWFARPAALFAVCAVAAGYSGFAVWTFTQALSGQPFITGGS